jgi:cytochrome c5
MKHLRLGAAALITAGLLVACGGGEEPNKPNTNKPEQTAFKLERNDAEKAALTKAKEEVYAKICHTCHGMQGKGDGPAGVALNPKPRTFDDPEFHKRLESKGGLGYVKKVIVEGGPAVGLSVGMTPHPVEAWPVLKDEAVLTELAKYVVYDLGGYSKKL